MVEAKHRSDSNTQSQGLEDKITPEVLDKFESAWNSSKKYDAKFDAVTAIKDESHLLYGIYLARVFDHSESAVERNKAAVKKLQKPGSELKTLESEIGDMALSAPGYHPFATKRLENLRMQLRTAKTNVTKYKALSEDVVDQRSKIDAEDVRLTNSELTARIDYIKREMGYDAHHFAAQIFEKAQQLSKNNADIMQQVLQAYNVIAEYSMQPLPNGDGAVYADLILRTNGNGKVNPRAFLNAVQEAHGKDFDPLVYTILERSIDTLRSEAISTRHISEVKKALYGKFEQRLKEDRKKNGR